VSAYSSILLAPKKIDGRLVKEVRLPGLPPGHHFIPQPHEPGGFFGYILTPEGWRGYGIISDTVAPASAS
jgi:hypothetical protein